MIWDMEAFCLDVEEAVRVTELPEGQKLCVGCWLTGYRPARVNLGDMGVEGCEVVEGGVARRQTWTSLVRIDADGEMVEVAGGGYEF